MTRLALAALAILLSCAPTAAAAPGDLDTTYGTAGKVDRQLSPRHDRAEDVLMLGTDTLAIGWSEQETSPGSGTYREAGSLLRLTSTGADGDLIPNLPGDQSTVTYTFPRNARFVAGAVQGSKLVVVGHVENGAGESDFLLVRIDLATGLYDDAFGGVPAAGFSEGVVLDDFGAGEARALDVAIEPDNDIVVAGWTQPTGQARRLTVARYTPDGERDLLNFGANGRYFGLGDQPGDSTEGRAVALQDDGKIVVAGLETKSGGSDIRIDRLTSAGVADSAWDDDTDAGTAGGTALVQTNSLDLSGANDVLIDGTKIVVAGYGGPNGNQWVVARQLSTGMPDTSFGSPYGYLQHQFGSGSGGRANALVKSAGLYVVAGGVDGDFAVAGYDNGTLSTAFGGTDGYTITEFGTTPSEALGIAAGGTDRVYAAGYSGAIGSNADGFAQAKYVTAGDGPPPAEKPAPTAAPTLTVQGGGSLTVGRTLAAGNGEWTNAPTSFKHRWQRCDPGPANCLYVFSDGTTSALNDPDQAGLRNGTTYTTTAADEGKVIRVKVWASNSAGESTTPAQATSATVAAASTGGAGGGGGSGGGGEETREPGDDAQPVLPAPPPSPAAVVAGVFGVENLQERPTAGPVHANWDRHASPKRPHGLTPEPQPDRKGDASHFTLDQARTEVEQLATGTHPRFPGRHGYVSLKETPVPIERFAPTRPNFEAGRRRAGEILKTRFPEALPPGNVTSLESPLKTEVLFYDPAANCGANNKTLRDALERYLDKEYAAADNVLRSRRFASCQFKTDENGKRGVTEPIFRGMLRVGDTLVLKIDVPKREKIVECNYAALNVLVGKPWEDTAPGRGDGAQSVYEGMRRGTDCRLEPKYVTDRSGATVRKVIRVQGPPAKGKPGVVTITEPKQADLVLFLDPEGATTAMTFDQEWRLTADDKTNAGNRFRVLVDDKAIQYAPNQSGQLQRRDGLGGAVVDLYFDPADPSLPTRKLSSTRTGNANGGATEALNPQFDEPGRLRIEAVWHGSDGQLEGWTSVPVVKRRIDSCFTTHGGNSWRRSANGFVVERNGCRAGAPIARAAGLFEDLVGAIKRLFSGVADTSSFSGGSGEVAMRSGYEKTGAEVAQATVGTPASSAPAVPQLGNPSSIIASGGGNFGGSSAATGAGLVNGTGLVGFAPPSKIIASGGGNVIASGGGNVIASGGGNVIASGGGNVIASGGGNVIASGGGNVIASGGGNFVGVNGGRVIASGGGNIIASGGGNVIASGGGN